MFERSTRVLNPAIAITLDAARRDFIRNETIVFMGRSWWLTTGYEKPQDKNSLFPMIILFICINMTL